MCFLAISIPTQVVWGVVQEIEVMAGPPEWDLGHTLRSYESATSHGFLVMYYGPEFTAVAVREWLGRLGVQTLFIEPGSPWENGYVESFIGKLRDELLSREIFYTLTEAKVLRTPMIELDVRPLPPAPQTFSGLVGDFDISARVNKGELKVGESATLRLEVAGTGNVGMISEPRLPPLPYLKVYDDRPGSAIDRSGRLLKGSKSYRKALVPLEPGELTIPALTLTFFDPERVGMEVIYLDIGEVIREKGLEDATAVIVEHVQEHKPAIVGMGAYMTTTMLEMKPIITELESQGLRNGTKVMVGGVPTSQEFADEVGADAWGKDALDTMQKALQFVGGQNG